MQITAEESKKIFSFFQSKSVKCPVCGSSKCGIEPNYIYINSHDLGNDGKLNPLPSMCYKNVSVVCDNCAHTMLFNAAIIGV